MSDDGRVGSWERPAELVIIDKIILELTDELRNSEQVCPFAVTRKIHHLLKDLVSLGVVDYLTRLFTITAMVAYMFRESDMAVMDYQGVDDPRWVDMSTLMRAMMDIGIQATEIREATVQGGQGILVMMQEHGFNKKGGDA